MGLEILHPLSSDSRVQTLVVDIVAVHGLNGDSRQTWTAPKSKAFWLKDYLPNDVKGARVMTFSYNAGIVFGNTTASIKDHATKLLGLLLDQREGDEVKGLCNYSFRVVVD